MPFFFREVETAVKMATASVKRKRVVLSIADKASDEKQAEEFVSTFREFIQANKYSHNQIFNCDETGLNFRLLPDVTLASSFEKSADGRKKSKDRVTLNLCSNASCTI